MDNFNWRIILSFSIADATDNQVIIINLIVIAKEYIFLIKCYFTKMNSHNMMCYFQYIFLVGAMFSRSSRIDSQNNSTRTWNNAASRPWRLQPSISGERLFFVKKFPIEYVLRKLFKHSRIPDLISSTPCNIKNFELHIL